MGRRDPRPPRPPGPRRRPAGQRDRAGRGRPGRRECPGRPCLASSAVSVLGTASLRAGDLPGAARYLERDPARSARGVPPCTRLHSELTAGRISEALDGAAAAMGSLGLIYDALPRHTGALTGEPAAAAWLVRVAMATGDPRRADAVVDAAESIAWRNPSLPGPSVAACHARGLRDHDPDALSRAAAEHTDPWAGPRRRRISACCSERGRWLPQPGRRQSQRRAHLLRDRGGHP